MDKPKLTNIDIYCIARLIQNSFCAPDQETINTYRPFYGCMYCKYAASECNSPEKIRWRIVFKKLSELTGIPLSTCIARTERIGAVFLPESHYIAHPEDIHELERVHDPETVEKIKSWVDIVIAHSNGTSG